MIRILVADDSQFMRKVLVDLIELENRFSVVGEAVNGYDAYRKTIELKPDVVIMDLQMPFMDGVSGLKKIMCEVPTPTIILSALTKKNKDLALQCLEDGAIAIINKPSGTFSPDIASVKNELYEKINLASEAKVKKIPLCEKKACDYNEFKKSADYAKKIVVIASSTGGPATLEKLISMIPHEIDACVLIVQHMPGVFTESFASRLNINSALCVKEASDGDRLFEKIAYVAQGGKHMVVKNKKICLNDDPPIEGLKPNASLMFKSVVAEYGNKVIGVILTGMGRDGLEGSRAIKKAGGKVIAQDEKTSVIYGMPKEVADAKLADYILPIEEIAGKILTLLEEL